MNKSVKSCQNDNCPEQCEQNEFNPLQCFFSLPPIPFTLLSSIIGVLLIDDLTLDQQNSLGNFLVGVGQTILTAAAQGVTLKSAKPKNNHLNQQIKALREQLDSLEEQINN